MVEAARRAIAAENGYVGIDPGAVEHIGQDRAIVRAHRLLLAIRAQARDFAAHEQPGFVD